MSLVVKNKSLELTEGVKLYRDALVSKGTLTLFDFSNRGTTVNGNVNNDAIIYNLGRDSDLMLSNGVINTPQEINTLDAKKGFTTSGITSTVKGAFGINLNEDINNYIASNPNKEFLFIIWLNQGTNQGVQKNIVRTMNNNIYTSNDFRINANVNGSITVTVAGTNNATPETLLTIGFDTIFQIAVHYKGVGNKCDYYENGVLKGSSSVNATAFTAGNYFSIGRPESTLSESNQSIYRFLIEDLTLSQRTAQTVVAKDFNYVNALDEYQGIEKRPFSNI